MNYNIMVLGVGHSGTRFLVQLCSHLGWNVGKTDEHWELPEVVRINSNRLAFDTIAAKELINSLDPPWIIKDPRFIYTLPHWLDILNSQPILIHIERNADEILRSHKRRRHKNITKTQILGEQKRALALYNSYDGPKWSVTFEQIISAIETYEKR